VKIHNFEQRTEDWYNIRKGKMTASNADTIIANGKGLETYIYNLMAEYYSSAEKENYINADMQRGIDLEPEARLEFEFYTDLDVQEVGFIEYNEFIGVSPDGLIGDDGLIEIKCPNDSVYFKLLLSDNIKPEYIAQMQMQLYVTDRQYCYFVSYNPNFEKSLYIKKITRDEEMIEKLKKGLDKGTELIKEIKRNFRKVGQNGKIL
jgi:putative phage-type endonuclease